MDIRRGLVVAGGHGGFKGGGFAVYGSLIDRRDVEGTEMYGGGCQNQCKFAGKSD